MPKTNGAGDQGAPFQLPPDLTAITAEELAALREQATAEFEAIYDQEGGPKADDLVRAQELSDALDAIGADETRRQAEADKTAEEFRKLREKHTPAAETDPDGDGDAPPDTEGGDVTDGAPTSEPAAVPEPVAASGRTTGGARTGLRDLGGVNGPPKNLNPSLSGAARRGPAVGAPGTGQLAITASAEMPGSGGQRGIAAGAPVPTLDALADLIQHRASRLPVQASKEFNPNGPYGGVQVASIRNEFPEQDIVEWGTKREHVGDMVQRLTNDDVLVAAGGWCAPSEIRYDFFNVACADGMIDLPTFGVRRGGLRWPISPSLADVFTPAVAPFGATFSNATVPWLWTEGDDISSVTGNPNKPCIRVPCSDMDEARLECYGVCLTAGNLADDAWPEATRNFLALLMSAFDRSRNTRYISSMLSLAGTQITGSGCAAGSGTAAPLLGMAELAAVDIRTRFGMCSRDTMEYVAPDWVLPMVRSDLAKRSGLVEFAVTDAMVAQWFNVRSIRAQFVQDYQVRSTGLPGTSTPLTAWPTSMEFMIYPPGSFGRGNGMTLDLGVVRDSTLNAENDHTAAWFEECHLIARFGHSGAVRRYAINLCTDGTTGAADLTACCP
jgi:hypothetical protein